MTRARTRWPAILPVPKAYQAFIEFRTRADLDVPLLLEAKAEYAKLAG